MARRFRMMRILLAVSVGVLWAAAARAQDIPAGARMTEAGSGLFQTYCVVCHGQQARGDGPLAESLVKKPADLTGLAKRNGGTYPSDLVYRIIDGKNPVKGHGGGDMPVWGDAFARSREVGGPSAVKDRIEALVRYLETIQPKP